MKYFLFILSFVLGFISCKTDSKKYDVFTYHDKVEIVGGPYAGCKGYVIYDSSYSEKELYVHIRCESTKGIDTLDRSVLKKDIIKK